MKDHVDNLFAEIDTPPVSLGGEALDEGKKDIAPQGVGEEPKRAGSGVVAIAAVSEQPSFIEPKADLIVGATGSGKTTQIGETSDYILAKYGKLTRLASTDPSGAGPLAGMVKSGQIEFWPVHAWPKPIEAMFLSTKGYWPLRVHDPESPLIPPDAGTYEVYGLGAFEGLTSYGDTVLAELKRTKASLSQDPSYTWNQGEFSTSGGNMSYYGMMQDTLNLWVINTHLLRYQKVLWTALESRGDDQSGSKVYGPMIGGKKATGKAGQWFVNFFHMDIIAGKGTADPVTGQSLIETKHVLFLKTHIDPLTMIPFPCKVRAPKEYAKEVPPYIESGSIAEAYLLLDKLYEKQMKGSSAKLNEISGLRERLLERAAIAQKAEAMDAEKRAKAAGLLKPMVSVPAMPFSGKGAVGGVGAIPVPAAHTVTPVLPVQPAPPSQPSATKTQLPSIQTVRKTTPPKG